MALLYYGAFVGPGKATYIVGPCLAGGLRRGRVLTLLCFQLQPEARVVAFVAVTAGDGVGVATGAGVFSAAVGTLVEVADGAAFAALTLAARALLVQQAAQFFQPVAGDGCLVGGDRVVAVMAMAARRAVDAVRQVNQFVRHRDLYRLRLHVRLNEDQVAMARLQGTGVMRVLEARQALLRRGPCRQSVSTGKRPASFDRFRAAG